MALFAPRVWRKTYFVRTVVPLNGVATVGGIGLSHYLEATAMGLDHALRHAFGVRQARAI